MHAAGKLPKQNTMLQSRKFPDFVFDMKLRSSGKCCSNGKTVFAGQET